VLIQEVVSTICARLEPDCEIQSLFAIITPLAEATMWADAASYPANMTRKRLILVKHAQNITHWDNLESLLEHSRELRHLYMIFVSDEDVLPRVVNAEDKEVLAPHVACLRDAAQGQIVVCSTPNERDLMAWVKRQMPCGDNLAYHLLTRTAGNLAVARDVCMKASLFPTVSQGLVDELCAQAPGEDFADALVAGDKREALAAAAELDPDELGSLIGLLDARLDMLGVLGKALGDGMDTADLHSKLRLSQFVISKYRKSAPGYTVPVTQRRRAVLAAADSAYRTGARTGVAEMLVSLW
jgi:hypothetical protein